MITKELSEAAVEINSIFENMSKDLLQKIPENFKKFFLEIASKDYKFQYNTSLSLKEQKLSPKTKGILALIYRDYLCNDIEKELYNIEYKKVLLAQQRKKNNINNIFTNNFHSKKNNIITTLPVKYKKNSLFEKIYNKLKKNKKI